MSLAATYTLNIGTPPLDRIYGSQSRLDGQAVEYYAPSAQGDLVGRPRLRISHETTNKGIVRSLVSLYTPVWDPTKGLYTMYRKNDYISNRDQADTLVGIETEIEAMAKLLPMIKSIIAAGGI
jgi:hypothetical protein